MENKDKQTRSENYQFWQQLIKDMRKDGLEDIGCESAPNPKQPYELVQDKYFPRSLS